MVLVNSSFSQGQDSLPLRFYWLCFSSTNMFPGIMCSHRQEWGKKKSGYSLHVCLFQSQENFPTLPSRVPFIAHQSELHHMSLSKPITVKKMELPQLAWSFQPSFPLKHKTSNHLDKIRVLLQKKNQKGFKEGW